MPGPNDPNTKLAVDLGAEHPGALIDDQDLEAAGAEASEMTRQAIEARQHLANTHAGQLLAITHRQIQNGTKTIFVPKPDISADLEGVTDDSGNEVLAKIGKQVLEGYELDKRSRSDWEKRSAEAMDLALQVTENKSWPWANAANVKLPLITTAAIQFHARAYPAIVPGQQIVKGVPMGADPDGMKMERGDRIGKHMSYQVSREMADWREDTDKLLLNVAIVGCAFRKTYFDHTVGQNRSDMVIAKHLVVNHRTKSLLDARRISEEVDLYENDIEERMRSGRFRRIDLALKKFGADDDPAHQFIEQHTWYDLDGDGYREPYICVVHKESKAVVRIAARFEAAGITVDDDGAIVKISPDHYYTKFSLIPNPDGGFYDVGLGYLLCPLTETANTVMNQMLDAGTLANTGGGFIGRGLRLKGGPIRFAPGEYVPVDAKGAAIKENIVPMIFPGPSPVLFQLLGLLIEMSKDVASVKDVLTGESVPANQPATTTLALIDQGLKVFTAIFQRLHRSLEQEFQKIYRLNGLFLDPEVYFRFQDVPIQVLLADYQAGDLDIVPITDPSVVAGPVKLIKAQALMGLVGRGLNDMEIYKRFLEAIEEPNIDRILPQQDPEQLMQDLMMRELTIRRMVSELEKVESEIDANIAKSIKALAEAAMTQASQVQLYAQQVGGLSQSAKAGESKGASGKSKGKEKAKAAAGG
jgi:chaperonin GroES